MSPYEKLERQVFPDSNSFDIFTEKCAIIRWLYMTTAEEDRTAGNSRPVQCILCSLLSTQVSCLYNHFD